MARVLQLRRSLLSLSKPPQASSFPNLVGDHGRYNTRVSNIFDDRVQVSANKNSPYGFRTFYAIGTGRLISEFVSCNAKNWCRTLTFI